MLGFRYCLSVSVGFIFFAACEPGAVRNPGPPVLQDEDGDGFHQEEDCNDQNADVYPGATERCDQIDNDCDGLVDNRLLGVVFEPYFYPKVMPNFHKWSIAPTPGVSQVSQINRENGWREEWSYDGLAQVTLHQNITNGEIGQNTQWDHVNDDEGKLIESFIKIWGGDDKDYMVHMYESYNYDENQNVIKWEFDKNDDGQSNRTYESTYYGDGRIRSLILSAESYSGIASVLGDSEYIYDDVNQTVTIQHNPELTYPGSEKSLLQLDSDGRISQRTEFLNYNQVRAFTYDYDEQGLLVAERKTQILSETDSTTITTEFNYDAEQNLIGLEESTQHNSDEPHHYRETDYHFDCFGE